MESIFAVVDVFVVAHLGADAVATVGLTESMMTMLYALAMGLSIGAGAMVARRIGEKNREAAAHTAAQVILFGAVLAVLLGVLGVAVRAAAAARDGRRRPTVLAHATFTRDHARRRTSASSLLFLLNSVLRSAGDAAIAMRVLWLANAINIVLCPAPDPRRRPVAGARHQGRGDRDDDRPQHRRGVRPEPAVPARRAGGAARPALRARPRAHRARRAAVVVGDGAGVHRHGELDRPRADPRGLRQRRARRLHDRHPHRDLRAAALVRPGQRRGDDGGPGARRGQAGARGARGVDRGPATACGSSASWDCCSCCSRDTSWRCSPATRRWRATRRRRCAPWRSASRSMRTAWC